MCILNISVYPCSHAVLLAYEPCKPGAHPQNCNPVNYRTRIRNYSDDSTLPQTCPCRNLSTLNFPIQPEKYANFCLRNKLSIGTVIDMIPAWLLDADGMKKGSRSIPWRVINYLVAYQAAKNDIAVGSAGLAGLPIHQGVREAVKVSEAIKIEHVV